MLYKIIWLFFCVFLSHNLSSQNDCFEKKSLDYFCDSIIGKKDPFTEYKRVHYKGFTDSTITYIQNEIRFRYNNTQVDSLYNNQKKENFWRNNIKKTEEIAPNKKAKVKTKKKYNKRTKTVRLIIYQALYTSEYTFVLFSTYIENGYEGYDIYFVYDKSGKLIDFISYHFIF